MPLCIERASYFQVFGISTTEYAFSEGFETGILTTSDEILPVVVDTSERHTYITDPLV